MELTHLGQTDPYGRGPAGEAGWPGPRSGGEGRSLIEWLRVLRDGLPALLALIVIGLGVGAVITALQPTSYKSTNVLVVGSNRGFLDPEFAQGLSPAASTVTRLASSATVLDGAATEYISRAPDPSARERRARQATIKWMGNHVKAQQLADSGIVELSAQASTQTDARALARAGAHSLERAVGTRIGIVTRGANGTQGTVLKDFSTRDQGKVSPTPVRNLLLGGNVGLVLGIVAGLALGAVRRRVRRPDDMASELGIPVLASVRPRRLGPGIDPALSTARARLQRLGQRDQGTVFLLTGTAEPEQAARVTESLARAFTASSRTVLVDADLSSRFASKHLNLSGAPGLGELLNGDRSNPAEAFRPEHVTVATSGGPEEGSQIEVLPAGATAGDPAAALSSAAFVRSLQSLRLRYDFILVSGPGLDRPAEVIPLVSAADWSVLITPSGERASTIESAHGLADALAGRIAGAVIINRR